MNLFAAIEVYSGGVGSGCKGPNCGRPATLYHGTKVSNVDSIAKYGLTKGFILPWNKKPSVSLTSKRKEAHQYAKKAEGLNWKSYAVVVVDSRKTNAKAQKDYKGKPYSYYYATHVPPKSIKRIEIYDKHSKLQRTIRPLVKSLGN